MKAAMQNHIRAQFYLGTCYDNGLGVKKDTKEAFKWYLEAAKKGHMESQFKAMGKTLFSESKKERP